MSRLSCGQTYDRYAEAVETFLWTGERALAAGRKRQALESYRGGHAALRRALLVAEDCPPSDCRDLIRLANRFERFEKKVEG